MASIASLMNALTDKVEEFRSAISAVGLTPPAQIFPDGTIHRFATNGKFGDRAGWYVFYGDHPAAGAFGDWRSSVSEIWRPSNISLLTQDERHAYQIRRTQLQHQREEEAARGHEEAAVWAAEIWEEAQPADARHPYLVKKEVPPNQLRVYRGNLSIAGCRVEGAVVVPAFDEHGKLWSLEFICADGEKRFLPGGRKQGCYCQLGEIVETACLTEGYATGASVHQGADLPVVIAFDAGNLRAVAETIRAKYPHAHLIICGDHDRNGTGQRKAIEAAQAVNGISVIPETEGNDWNDVYRLYGPEVVRAAILSKVHNGEETTVIPLDDVTLPPFPIDAFPDPLRSMIERVARATETPVELGAMMGLTTIAACCQKRFEVMIDDSYREPLSLWGVSALESGNRKTSVLQKMTEPLRVKERDLCEQSKVAIAEAESKRATAEVRVKAIRTRIANSETFEDIEKGQSEIDQVLAEMPELPTTPRLWAQDITPEKLGAVMADNGERLALLSDEGGLFDILAGRYSNGVPNLDLFLQSHAGASVRVDRGSRPPIVMDSPALTIGLSPQPGVLRGLTGKPGFRERGLLARFLYTLPQSRLGYRQLRTEPVPANVSEAYHNIVKALLEFEPTRNDYGNAVPVPIRLSPEAEQEWRDFAELVEVNMRPGGNYEHLKDWAGKLPGAALRVAGLFHCVQYARLQPQSARISLETMRAAVTVLAVIGQHTKAVFDLMGADPALDGARRVWRWIEENRKQQFTAQVCFQALRGSFPRMADLNPAISLLCERGYLLPEDDSKSGAGRKKRRFNVNSVLTKGWR